MLPDDMQKDRINGARKKWDTVSYLHEITEA
ncbi:MAG: hypothetical protein KatS3mg031_0482 [Chitinophagales bacterium]|nr:MAG: hypothetical protein KatS3mg031_0482 [Chitinophagales bacterium]